MEAYLARTLCLFFVVFPVQVFGIESFCIATSVSVGETASISCRFSEDLSKSPEIQRNVLVYLIKVLEENKTELVFSYQFVNGTAHAYPEPGYDNKSSLTDHLEIVIYNATKKHAGFYKCLVPASKKQPQLCCLKIHEDSNSVLTENCTATKTNYADLHSSSDSTVSGNAGKRDDANETEKGSTRIILAIVISISILAAVILVILLVILCYKRKLPCDRHRQLQMDQPAGSNDGENNTGIPQNGSVNGQGTSDVDESSNVLLRGESHPGHDEPTHDNKETFFNTKEELD